MTTLNINERDAQREWDEYFIEIANTVSIKSKDPSTKVGAIITKDNIILSTGFNGFPRGCRDDIPKRFERPLKYTWTIHAEENAIFNACHSGTKLEGATLYVTPLASCAPCALSIAQSGIRRVVYKQHEVNTRFADSIRQAIEILEESGIDLVEIL